MTPRSAALLFIIVSLLLPGCTTPHPTETRYYGLGDVHMNALGRDLGFEVEARGMSNYRFFKDDKTFFLRAHNDANRFRNGGLVADEPIIVFYKSEQLAIPIGQGMTLKELAAQIRGFLDRK